MKKKRLFRIQYLMVLAALAFLGGCGPVVISSRPSHPPPPWFYPNRLEVVRYVYFPEYSIYYDLSDRTYLYLDGGAWVRRNALPQRYQQIDLRRSKYERIRDYQEENIKRYHDEHNADRGRSNRTTTRARKVVN